jgi:hypothetical protein
MSATTHGVGMTDDFGESVATAARTDVDAVSGPPARFEAGAGDDWGTVLAVAALLVVLIVGVLVLGGG